MKKSKLEKLVITSMERPFEAPVYESMKPTFGNIFTTEDIVEFIRQEKGILSGSRAFNINKEKSDYDFFFTNEKRYEKVKNFLKRRATRQVFIQWGTYVYQCDAINSYEIEGVSYQITLVDRILSSKKAFVMSYTKGLRYEKEMGEVPKKYEALSKRIEKAFKKYLLRLLK